MLAWATTERPKAFNLGCNGVCYASEWIRLLFDIQHPGIYVVSEPYGGWGQQRRSPMFGAMIALGPTRPLSGHPMPGYRRDWELI